MNSKPTNKEQEKISGRTFIKNDEIIWESDKWGNLGQIPIKDIKIIGEYTTSTGPFQDDWFFVFILSDKDIRQVSAYAIGLEEILKQVERVFNTDLTGRLVSSTDWNSRVLWPIQFRGEEIFRIIEVIPISLWEKIKSKLGLMKQEMELTENLKKHLGIEVST